MGVFTTIYSVDSEMIKKVQTDNNNLAYIFDYVEDENGIFGPFEDKSKIWEVESFDFDTGVDVYIQIFRELNCEITARSIDSEYADLEAFDYAGYDIWVIPPSDVIEMVKELKNLNIESSENSAEVKDRRGNLLLDSQLKSYLMDIEDIEKFFNKVFEQGNYLIFSQA